jgi:hypothetical protein
VINLARIGIAIRVIDVDAWGDAAGEKPQLFAHLYSISQITTFTDGHEAIALLTQEEPSAESDTAK